MNTGHRSFSVVICVYTEDRWEDILAAVDSVRRQSLPPLETLLVVDHNTALLERLGREYGERAACGEAQARGEVRAACGEVRAACGEVRVLANAGPSGLSAGRNTGIAHARGELVAFLDDDAVAERDWLRFFDESYENPRVLAVGGRTLPAWSSGRRPDWFPEEFDWVVGCTYRGLPEGRVRVRNVLGGNASFRRSAFDAAGGFATGIGRREGDGRPLGGEETELCIRLAGAVPDAVLLIDDRSVIHHKVPAVRERFGYFRERAYAEGLSKALVARSVGTDKGLESERRYTTRVLPAGVVRGVRDAVAVRVRRGARPGGLGRAGAIGAGVVAAAVGYLVGRFRTRGGAVTFSWGPIEREGAGAGPSAGALVVGGPGSSPQDAPDTLSPSPSPNLSPSPSPTSAREAAA